MADKPGDFYVGIIEFFGILVPGAILLYMQKGLAVKYLPWSYSVDNPAHAFGFAIGSYVAGHFLMAAGAQLNRLHRFFYSETKDPYYQEVRKRIVVPSKDDRTNVFYRAFAYIRLKSPSGLAEIERQMAEYKMFRSLVLVFALDAILQALTRTNPGWLSHVFISLGLCVAAGWQFLDLLN